MHIRKTLAEGGIVFLSLYKQELNKRVNKPSLCRTFSPVPLKFRQMSRWKSCTQTQSDPGLRQSSSLSTRTISRLLHPSPKETEFRPHKWCFPTPRHIKQNTPESIACTQIWPYQSCTITAAWRQTEQGSPGQMHWLFHRNTTNRTKYTMKNCNTIQRWHPNGKVAQKGFSLEFQLRGIRVSFVQSLWFKIESWKMRKHLLFGFLVFSLKN